MPNGVLGSGELTENTETTAYQPGAGITGSCTLILCNSGTVDVMAYVGVAAGTNMTPAEYIMPGGFVLPAKSRIEVSAIVISSAHKLRVQVDQANCNYVVMGYGEAL